MAWRGDARSEVFDGVLNALLNDTCLTFAMQRLCIGKAHRCARERIGTAHSHTSFFVRRPT
jgi:hypothetical protein